MMFFFISIFPAPRNGAMYRVDGPEAIADAIFALFFNFLLLLLFYFDYLFIIFLPYRCFDVNYYYFIIIIFNTNAIM